MASRSGFVSPPSLICVNCKREGVVPLACKQHHICVDCLKKNAKMFGYQEMYTCPECTKPTAQPPHVWIFADNSNIWIMAMKRAAERKKFTRPAPLDHDHRVRIDYGGYLHPDKLAKNSVVKKATLYGSVPPPVDTFWERVKTYDWVVKTYERSYVTGKEKEVDTELVADVTEVVCKTPPYLRGTIIIISGDRDMRPAVKKSLENGFKVEMYIWKNAASLKGSLDKYKKEHPGRVSYQYLDDIEAQATYLNREFSEKQQDDMYNCSALISIGRGKTVEDIIKSEEWWNKLEMIAKWPVEYKRMKDGDKNKHLLLIFQGMERKDLKELVEKISTGLQNVEQCKLYSKSLQKTGYEEDEDGYKTKVPGIKPSKSGAAASNTISSSKPSLPDMPPTNRFSEPCCSGRNCDRRHDCEYHHSKDDIRYFEKLKDRKDKYNNTLRKTQPCRHYPHGPCRFSTINCDFAHEENDSWCMKCHKTGHFRNDCKNPPCQHTRHSES